MLLTHKRKGLVLFGTTAVAVAGLAVVASAAPIPKDTVITTHADNNSGDPDASQIILLNKDGDPTGFAHVDPGTDRVWLAPIGIGPDGHLYLAMATGNGSLLDVSEGGDRSTAKPLATGIFTVLPRKVGGMAFDAEGNVYLSLTETQAEHDDGNHAVTYPIVRVNLKTGQKSTLNALFDHATGIAIRKDANNQEILYVAEVNAGRVRTYNLTTDKLDDKPLATGFPGRPDHGIAAMAFDPRGRLFVAWRMDPDDDHQNGIFDITNGGDFSDFTRTPPVLMATEFAADLNGLAFDSKNNLYIGGDNHYTFYSPFDAAKGTFGDLSEYANDNLGGDSESVVVAP